MSAPSDSRVGMLAVALFAGFLLMGCASTGVLRLGNGPGNTDLDAWVDEQLAPYLVDQLSRQPRFKGEPVLLVSMNGADVRPDIDALTRDVRSRLTDRLLRAPGADLYWRPTVGPWEHHRGEDRLRCNTASTARYFIGIDIAPASGETYRVSVRALDVGAAAWVTGFGESWQGRLTPNQQRALGERQTDEYLRGLRALPFSADETDLLAAYLARNLSCLLRERGAADYRVFVDSADADEPHLRKVLNLVAHNLGRHRGAQTVDRAVDAELVLSISLNQIDGSLYQLWLEVRATSSDAPLSSVDTDAYVFLNESVEDPVQVASIEPTPVPRFSFRQRSVVLSKLRVVTALDMAGCVDEGRKAHAPLAAVDPDECFWIEFDLHRPAHVLVLRHTVDGALTRLSPWGCPSSAGFPQPLVPRHKLRVAGEGGRGFLWAGRSGIESVYAIAATNVEAAWELADHVDTLPDGCAGNAYGVSRAEDYRQWLARLDTLIDRGGDEVDWQAVRVRHAQP